MGNEEKDDQEKIAEIKFEIRKKDFLKRQQCVYFMQIIILVGSMIFVGVAYKGKLWSQTYVEQVIETWETGPIVQIEWLDSTSKKIPKCDTKEGWEAAGAATWYGMEEGCMCPGSRDFVEVDNKRCTSEMMLGNTCYPIAPMKQQELPVINGKVMCVKRGEQNLFDMMVANSTLEGDCAEGFQSCNNGTGANTTALCIGINDTCPITQLSYTEEVWDNTTDPSKPVLTEPSVVALTNDSSINTPVVNFLASQGVPCINAVETNTVQNKQKYKLQPPDYYRGCVTSIEDTKLAPLWTPVPNFEEFSEYQWYADNNQLKYMKRLIKFNMDATKNYMYTLYQQNYPVWSQTCSAHGINPSAAKDAVRMGKGITAAAWWYFFLITFQMCMILLGLLSNHFASNGGCDLSSHKVFTRVRFLSSFVIFFACVACVWSIAVNKASAEIDYLQENTCSQDPVLNMSFVNMGVYLDNKGMRVWISTIFLGLMALLDIAQMLNALICLPREPKDDNFQKVKNDTEK